MSRNWAGAMVVVGSLLATGCENRYTEITQRLNAPPQGYSGYPSTLSDPLAMQVDNGVMADMTLADIHFVPGRPELNALGDYRLRSMVTALRSFGGTVFIFSETRSKELETQRIQVVEQYLNHSGLKEVAVTTGFGYARGMSAREAIPILKAMRARALSTTGSGTGVVTGAASGTSGGPAGGGMAAY